MDLSNLNLQVKGLDLLVSVLVQSGARRDKILGLHDGFLKISVTAPPAEGKANAACRRLLADALGIPVGRVEVIAGAKARRKRIRIRNADVTTVKEHLAPFLE
ncbi:MAG: DUF167 domain-containing protein [Candidatus Methylomirabilales bacterium]